MKKNNLKDLILTSVLAAIVIVMTFVPQLGYITVGTTAVTLIPIPVFIGVFLLPLQYSLILGLFFGVGSLIQALPYEGTLSLNKAFINPLVSVLPRLLTVVLSYLVYQGLKKIKSTVKQNDILIFSIIIVFTVVLFYYSSQQIITFTGWNDKVVTLIALLVISGFITLYYAFINKRKEDVMIPSALILSSFLHTIVVLLAVLLFESDVLHELFVAFPTFADSEIGILITIAATNGVVETLFAAVIGTPIIIALKNVQKRI
ncbi:MAG: ECF transporter S component [Acholeplasmataceae bacterium]